VRTVRQETYSSFPCRLPLADLVPQLLPNKTTVTETFQKKILMARSTTPEQFLTDTSLVYS